MIVGIDLGTSNSAISYIDENGNAVIIPNSEGDRTTPSVIYFEDGTAVVGEPAKSIALTDPENSIQFVKRQIGNPSFKFPYNDYTYSTEELSAIILKKLKK